MYFFIAFAIVAIACSAITIKTLVGYNDMRLLGKLGISLVILAGWFAPLLACGIYKFNVLSGELADYLISALYYLFGFCFILIMLILVRDAVWYLIYGLAKMLGLSSWSIIPKNISVLNHANVVVTVLSLIAAGIAAYNGNMAPREKLLVYHTPKLAKDMTFVQVSDMHITRRTPVEYVENIVNLVNAQKPDAIFLTGDIVDDKLNKIQPQLQALSKLKGRYGILASIGNHELYSGINSWLKAFKDMGIWVLFNKGVQIGKTPVYVAGIPDMNTSMVHPSLNVDFPRALKTAKDNQYKILLSHNPEFVDYINGSLFDLQLSGHTHGGQIFPFHMMVKYSNKYLSGQYQVNGVNLYVTNGAGTWGPQMRLFAPAEIAVIKLIAEKNKK